MISRPRTTAGAQRPKATGRAHCSWSGHWWFLWHAWPGGCARAS